jgi:spore germination protein GerM
MKFVLSSTKPTAFTLAEVLAALLFMALVIPVAIEGLHIATTAGEVAQRKGQAARVAERILNENLVTTNWTQPSQSGTVVEGTREFRWEMHNEIWNQMGTNQLPVNSTANQLGSGQPQVNQFAASQVPMNLLTVEVKYSVQATERSVRLSTLVSSP